MKQLRVWSWGAGVLLAEAVGHGCCEDFEPTLGGEYARMDLGFDLAFQVEFDWDMQTKFEGSLAVWSKIHAAVDANIAFAPEGLVAFSTSVEGDVDGDGVSEQLRLLAFADDPSHPERVFAAWEGDKYSFDTGICYVLWWQGDTVELLRAECGAQEPAVHCVLEAGDRSSLACQACNDLGVCANCEVDLSVAACMEAGRKTWVEDRDTMGTAGAAGTDRTGGSAGGEREPHKGGSQAIPRPRAGAGAGGNAAASEVAGKAGSSGAAGVLASAGQGGGAGEGLAPAPDYGTCGQRVEQLTRRAASCGLGDPRATDLLCSQRASDVDLCYFAVEAAGLLGAPCTVLEDDVACGRVFP